MVVGLVGLEAAARLIFAPVGPASRFGLTPRRRAAPGALSAVVLACVLAGCADPSGLGVIVDEPDAGPGVECGLRELPACRRGFAERECRAAGGQWSTTGPTSPRYCACPTPDALCPCTSSTQCQGGCEEPIKQENGERCVAGGRGQCARFFEPATCQCLYGPWADIDAGSVGLVCRSF